MRLSFHGAARTVTGSCHLLEAGGRRILVDCGLFQGGAREETLNRAPFGFDPASIDVLLLTHAHLDHCGRIPRLVAEGFRGRILCTAATRDLAKLVLLDAARLQEEDARRTARLARRHGRKPEGPLYTVADVLDALDFFAPPVQLDQMVELGGGLQMRFREAGHILGSTFLEVEAGEGRGRRRIVFSGDVGNPGRPLLNDPAPPPECDYLVVESTYGDRPHRPLAASVDELVGAIRDTFARGGNAVIPTFALERAQEILWHLGDAVRRGVLPAWMPVFLDSPMAISATRIFRRHAELLRPPARALLRRGRDPFALPGLEFTREVAESMAINAVRGGAVILAGSGMCTGGRVVHHLKHNLWRPESSVIFVGFAAKGTLARRIIDGARSVQVLGERVAVRAAIHTINGFSAHAGQDDLLAWVAGAGHPRRVFLVHGEEARGMRALAGCLRERGLRTSCPRLHAAATLA